MGCGPGVTPVVVSGVLVCRREEQRRGEHSARQRRKKRTSPAARLHAVRACSVGGAPTAAVELAHQRGKDQDTIAAPAASITSDEWAEGHE
ncbi:hypothetical protein ACCO45_002411 [Purpureocillium lilacinum]|uniref:Uncharacterized protein n=1 Tax=Purpureocillium lilacinum TaxID=33203 RepID=A0ACC4E9Z1_PURLI